MAAVAMANRWAEPELLSRVLVPLLLLYATLQPPALLLHAAVSLVLLLLSLMATPATDTGAELDVTHASHPLCAYSTLTTTATTFATACSISRARSPSPLLAPFLAQAHTSATTGAMPIVPRGQAI